MQKFSNKSETDTHLFSISAEDSEGESAGGRDWFYRQRAYPLPSIPRGARLRALEQEQYAVQRQAELRARGGLTMLTAQQSAWVALGPRPIGVGLTLGFPRVATSGRVTAIAFDPRYNGTTNQTVYVGGAQGGVWRSTDNGANWTPLTDDQPSLAIGAIAVDPTNPNVIYVGTGEPNRAGDTYYGAGLLKSTDGGASWTQIVGPVSTTAPQRPAFLYCSFNKIEIDLASPNTIYAATNIGLTGSATSTSTVVTIGNRGIWKSTDGGQTWRNLSPANDNVDRTATDVLLDPANRNRVYAAVLNLGVYRSDVGGEPGTWTKVANGLPDPGSTTNPAFRRIALTAAGSTFYAAFAAANDELFGIWKSTDGGANWTQATSPQRTGQANYNLDISVDPSEANTVYYGTSVNGTNSAGTLWRSKDGGQTWRDLSTGNGATGGLHADTHAIVVSPANRNVLFTGNDGGIWRTDNATEDTVGWTQVNSTLNLTQFQSIALHPTNANILIGGTQDNGTLRFDGNPNWATADGGDGGFVLIDQSNPQVVYHTYFNQNNEGGQRALIGPAVSTNGGQSWQFRGCDGCRTAVQGNFHPADPVAFYAPMALHTGYTGAAGNVVYFGTNRLYRTADRGLTWTGLGASSDGFGAALTRGQGNVITAVSAHPSRVDGKEIVWVGTSDGSIQITANADKLAEATFANLTKAPLPNRFVTEIALDARDQQRAVSVYSGFDSSTANTPGHVFLTINQGQSWTNISGDLPDVPVTSVVLDPNNPNTIYLGTDLGVFQTTNGGANWARLGNGMPRVATFMLRHHAPSNSLVAATHGRGIYRLSLTPTTPGAIATVSAASFSASAIASEAIVAAFGAGLATATQAATTQPLPTTLAGTRVSVRDSAGAERLAPLFFVSAGQVNYLIPAGTAAGAATVTITSGNGGVSTGAITVSIVAPALFTANADGRGAAIGAALRVRGGVQTTEPLAQRGVDNRFVPAPLDLGPAGDEVFLVLFGTGFRFRNSQLAVTATLGGVSANVTYAGAQGGFTGLDQANIQIPRSLAGRGVVDVVLNVEGRAANAVQVNVK